MQPKARRIVIVVPQRSITGNIAHIFGIEKKISTYLRNKHPDILEKMCSLDGTFGIVAGTGIGKSVGIKDICIAQFGEDFTFSVVTGELHATDETWESDVLICTTGVAMNYLREQWITDEDYIIIDEIHNTSEHMELAQAIAKHDGIRVSWMSATIEPDIYRNYFNTDFVFECDVRDPEKRAKVSSLIFSWNRYDEGVYTRDPWIDYLLLTRRFIDQIIDEQRGVAVFLPTRAMCESACKKYSKEFPQIDVDFYHGGESASKLNRFLNGDVPKPFIVFMTIAGSSSLNIEGLDTVIIHDQIFVERFESNIGVKYLSREHLDNNTLLQMAGRVDGRVGGSLVIVLTDRQINYHSLKPHMPEFKLAGEVEYVAMTCANMGISLDELDPIAQIDHDLYATTKEMLIDREIIDEDGLSLTEYGEAVYRLPVSRAWAELIVTLLEAQDTQLLPVLLICSVAPSLFSLFMRGIKPIDYKLTIREFEVENNDFLTRYNIFRAVLVSDMTYVINDRDSGKPTICVNQKFWDWCKSREIYGKTLANSLQLLASVFNATGVLDIRRNKNAFPELTDETISNFKRLLMYIDSLEMLNCHFINRSHKTQTTFSPLTVCDVLERQPMYVSMSVIEDKFGLKYIAEGVALEFEECEDYLDKVGDDVEFEFDFRGNLFVCTTYAGFGFDEFYSYRQKVEALPEELNTPEFVEKAKQAFIKALAENYNRWLSHSITIKIMAETDRIYYEHNPNHITFEQIKVMFFQKMLEDKDIYSLPMFIKYYTEKSTQMIRSNVGSTRTIQPSYIRTAESSPTEPATIDALTAKFRTPVVSDEPIAPLPKATSNTSDNAGMFDYLHGQKPLTTAKRRKLQAKAERRRLAEENPKVNNNEPKGMTLARINWLEKKIESLQNDINALESEAQQLKIEADRLGEAYSKAHTSKDSKAINALSAWQKACEEVTKTCDKNEPKKTKLQAEIDNMETEILEIMEVLDI